MEAIDMYLDGSDEQRRATAYRRRGPCEPHHLHFSFNGDDADHGNVKRPTDSPSEPSPDSPLEFAPDRPLTGPIELTIEATNADGVLASWLVDEWWAELLAGCGNCCVTLRFAPTPGALIHPSLLPQLRMIRRVAPEWRIVGHAPGSETLRDADIAMLAASPYHEIRFENAPVRTLPNSDRTAKPHPIEHLFAAIRKEQQRVGVRTPILVRLPSKAPQPNTCSLVTRITPASDEVQHHRSDITL